MALISRKTVTFAGVAGVVLLGLGGGYLVASPIYSEWSENQTTIADSRALVEQANAQRDSLRRAEAIYPQVLAGNEELEERFPTLADTSSIVDEIHEAARLAGIPESGVSSIGITPPAVAEIAAPAPVAAEGAATAPVEGEAPAAPVEGEAPAAAPTEAPAAAPADGTGGVVDPASLAGAGSGSGYATFDISVTVNGTDAQIADFLTALNEMSRITLVDQFSIGQAASAETGPELKSVSFVAQVFVYQEIPSVEATQAEAETAAETAPAEGALPPAVEESTEPTSPAAP